jgi:hypothetical protein
MRLPCAGKQSVFDARRLSRLTKGSDCRAEVPCSPSLRRAMPLGLSLLVITVSASPNRSRCVSLFMSCQSSLLKFFP